MKWSTKVLLDAIIATIAGCFLGGSLFAMLIHRSRFDTAQPIESLHTLAELGLSGGLFTLPFSLFFALWLTIPAAYAMAALEKDGRPRSLLLHLLTPVGLAAVLIVPPLVPILAQQHGIDTASLPNDPQAKMQRLNTMGGFLVAFFFGAHVLLQGSSAAVAFYLLRRRRLGRADRSGTPPVSHIPRAPDNRSAPKPWSKQGPWS